MDPLEATGDERVRYPGGDNGGGCYQRRINQMPPHAEYVEAFLGSGAVMRMKRRATLNYGLDLDPWATAAFRDAVPIADSGDGIRLLVADSIEWLAAHPFIRPAVVYCDPPWLLTTRTKRRIYQHEMTDRQHRDLLAVLTDLPAMVMLAGYPSAMYHEALTGWRVTTAMEPTRGGPRQVNLWTNYPEPTALHDYRYLGNDYRQRETIARRQRTILGKIHRLHPLERAAVLDAIRRSTIAETGGNGRHRR